MSQGTRQMMMYRRTSLEIVFAVKFLMIQVALLKWVTMNQVMANVNLHR
jgi:hypothetical protein